MLYPVVPILISIILHLVEHILLHREHVSVGLVRIATLIHIQINYRIH